MTKSEGCGQLLMVPPRDEPGASAAERPLDLHTLFTMHASYVWNTLR